MGKVFVAGRKLKIGPDVRQVGEPVPEAVFFPDRAVRAMLNLGHLVEVHEADLSPDQQEKLSLYLENVRPKHVGGGVYELPTGKRVKGKEEAYKQMADFGFFLEEQLSIDGEDGDGEAENGEADGVTTDGEG